MEDETDIMGCQLADCELGSLNLLDRMLVALLVIFRCPLQISSGTRKLVKAFMRAAIEAANSRFCSHH